MKKETNVFILSYVCIVILLLFGAKIENYFKNYASMKFVMSYFFYGRAFHYILFAIIGGLIGMGRFITEKDKRGKWKADGIKIAISSVLPTFYTINLITLLIAYKFQVAIPLRLYVLLGNAFLIGEMRAESLIMVIWGYIFITSFKKVEVSSQNEFEEIVVVES